MGRPPAIPREKHLERLQQAAVMRARGVLVEDIAAHFGVTRKTIHAWLTGPESGPAHALAKEVAAASRVQKQAQAVVSGTIVPIRPGVQSEPAVEFDVNADQDTQARQLMTQALKVLHTALVEDGNPKVAMWVLDRLDPERFGSASDKQTMAEVRKAAIEANRSGRTVVVKISTPKRRDAEEAAKTGTEP